MTVELAFIGLSTGEIMVILLVVLLLFGAAKIPQLMRSMGSGINQFKKGLKDGEAEAKSDEMEKK
jgi:sec-independent protein translocase protein TatA